MAGKGPTADDQKRWEKDILELGKRHLPEIVHDDVGAVAQFMWDTQDFERVDMLEDSKTDRRTWEALILLVKIIRRRDPTLLEKYPLLGQWAAGVDDGTLNPPPRPPHRLKKGTTHRDLVIALIMREIVDIGRVKPTANPSSGNPSACNLAEKEYPWGLKTMEAIWTNDQKARRANVLRLLLIGRLFPTPETVQAILSDYSRTGRPDFLWLGWLLPQLPPPGEFIERIWNDYKEGSAAVVKLARDLEAVWPGEIIEIIWKEFEKAGSPDVLWLALIVLLFPTCESIEHFWNDFKEEFTDAEGKAWQELVWELEGVWPNDAIEHFWGVKQGQKGSTAAEHMQAALEVVPDETWKTLGRIISAQMGQEGRPE